MKKEVFFAIAIGFIVGLFLTLFIYKGQLFRPGTNQILSPLSDGKNRPSLTPFPSQTLSLISPIDQSIVKEGKVSVSGITSPSSWVIIMGEKGEKMIQADNKGSFETDLLVVSGENEIIVTAVDEKGEEIKKTVTIVYSTAEI